VSAESSIAGDIRDAGDSALLLELEARVDATVNARAIAMADSVRGAKLPGVRDVVSTYRSVAVFFDPLRTRIESVVAALDAASHAPASSAVGPPIEIPVAYGGEFGPDLTELAAWAHLTEADVVRRHSSIVYRVFMLGFVPGFAYMGTVDESIAAPRRVTPRLRVPAGSVAVAARQTGIYPQETPGGWHIIGRTGVKPFDPFRTPAILFAPGDHVRFVPSTGDESMIPLRPHSVRRDHRGSSRRLVVIRPGLLTTVQDPGRWGHQDRGVPVAGPMDPVASRIANALVGNPHDAATLEVTLLGPELRIEQETTIAIAGADLSARLDDVLLPTNSAVRARRGSVLRFGQRRSGTRAYVAFDGGIDVAPTLGSRATHVLSRMGGFDGRPLVAGDDVPLGTPSSACPVRRIKSAFSCPTGGARLRVLPGPQDDFFGADAFEILQRSRFTISPQSDRMAYRLSGGTIRRATDREMISDATFFGAIQVPASGDPILLMADRQTSGGYPQIATVITADLPLAAQLAPGDWVEFSLCTRREALSALIHQEGKLLAVG
jgi:antagonist of KipI